MIVTFVLLDYVYFLEKLIGTTIKQGEWLYFFIEAWHFSNVFQFIDGSCLIFLGFGGNVNDGSFTIVLGFGLSEGYFFPLQNYNLIEILSQRIFFSTMHMFSI